MPYKFLIFALRIKQVKYGNFFVSHPHNKEKRIDESLYSV